MSGCAKYATAQSCTGLGTTEFSDIIYVSTSGQPTSTGEIDDPTDLLTAFTLTGGNRDKIYVQDGTYILSNPLLMQSDVQLVGGYNSNWIKDNTAVTTILRDANNVEPSPNRLVGIQCIGISNFKIQDLTVQVQAGQGFGTSVYGIYLNNCSDYELVRTKVISGNGGNGTNGPPGVSGVNGAPGEPGQEGAEDESGPRAGGLGGTGTFPGSNPGGNGGDGGIRGTYEFPAGGEAFPGEPGLDGSGMGGGLGADPGVGNFRNVTPLSCDRTPANDGKFGGNGASGQIGSPGNPGSFSFGGGFFQPGSGTNGTAGTHGSGGGGGGGGGSSGGITWLYIPWPIDDTIPPNLNGTGPGGGGGGEGGQAGEGGVGGQGAGSSFGVFLWDNGFNGVMKDCEIQVGNGGIGGQGGSGGDGGFGGPGGQGGALFTACLIGAGGSGGNGGNGGDGGPGGKGSDGISEEIYQQQGGQPLSIQNIYGLSQPAVTVEHGGCTNAPVHFSTDVSGTVQWFFGAGSDPVSAYGQEAVTSFSTPGYKTFTLVVNGIAFTYTDFVDIHAVVPALDPEIQTGSTQLCAGDIADFNSSISANNYRWRLRNIEGDTVTFDGPTYYDLLGVAFDTAGVYELILTTETECCGQGFSDTLMITVDSIVLPDIEIQTSFADTTNTICELSEITFTATADDVGPDPTYNWMINGTSAGGNIPVFTTDQLTNQDVVTCEVTSSFGCATGETALSNSVTVNVVQPLQVTCSADSFITNEPTYFESAVVSGGLAPFEYYWSFGNGALGFGDTVQHIYQNTGIYTASLEVIDSLGCSATCQILGINIAPNLFADFDLDTLNGCAPFQVQFENTSQNAVTQFWDFGDGTFSIEENPTHLYQTAGTYDVRLAIYSGTGQDSASVLSQIVVNPSPTANFSDFVVNLPEGGDSVQFADNSISATSWLWNFDDPGSGAENSSTEQNPFHVFSSNGTFNVTLVVENIYGCTDSITIPSSVNVGLSELEFINDASVYPNPTTGNVILTLDNKLGQEEGSIILIDQSGRQILTESITLTNGKNQIEQDYTQLDEGVFVLVVQVERDKIAIPLIIVKE